MTAGSTPGRDLAASCISRLTAAGDTVATAESLTAGLISATLATVPGASAALRGGVTAYATAAKATVLRVPETFLEKYGAVSEECARAMAEAVRGLFDASWGISATGVAGPERQEGRDVGTVFVAAAGPDGTEVVEVALSGGRNEIRSDATKAALKLLLAVVTTPSEQP